MELSQINCRLLFLPTPWLWNFIYILFAEPLQKIQIKMAGEAELTGLAKHFNSVTHTGRANVAKVSANRRWLYLPDPHPT